jgi:hypothetical protein
MSDASFDSKEFWRKFAAVLALFGSDNSGEAANADQMARQLLRAVGLKWVDIAEALRSRADADETIATILAENTALREQMAALQAQGSALAPAWEHVESVSHHRSASDWVLGLQRTGRIWLSASEIEFLVSMKTWRGRPTPAQEVWLLAIVDRAAQRTGQRPPP